VPRFLLLLAAVVALPVALGAQQLEVGARIRVWPPCASDGSCSPVVGSLGSISPDSIVLVGEDGARHALPFSPESRIQLSHGFRRRWPEGLAVGLLAGIAAGFVWQRLCIGPGDGPDDSQCSLSYLVTVPPGVLAGGIVGAHLKTEWWLAVPRIANAMQPVPGGMQLGFRVRF
jgi:hypothetical protein